MRRARIAVLAALVGAVLGVLPLPAQAQHRAVTVAADPFDQVARRTAKGDLVYRDTNGDGVIHPDRGRAFGAKSMYVDGADEVVIFRTLPADISTGEIVSPSLVRQSGVASAAALAADCWRKYGVSSAEAYWWSPSGIKYTFRWVFGVDYRYVSCQGHAVTSRYSAQLIAKRLSAATPAYLRNDDAYWVHYDGNYASSCTGDCVDYAGPRNFGAAYYADGENVYLGTEHSLYSYGAYWYSSESNTLKAVFTAPDPDHPTNVYYGCSRVSADTGEIAPWVSC
jgi:hypothetical protein